MTSPWGTTTYTIHPECPIQDQHGTHAIGESVCMGREPHGRMDPRTRAFMQRHWDSDDYETREIEYARKRRDWAAKQLPGFNVSFSYVDEEPDVGIRLQVVVNAAKPADIPKIRAKLTAAQAAYSHRIYIVGDQ